MEGLFDLGSRTGRTFGESVGGNFALVSSDWSNGVRYHNFDSRPDIEFKLTNPLPKENANEISTQVSGLNSLPNTICYPFSRLGE